VKAKPAPKPHKPKHPSGDPTTGDQDQTGVVPVDTPESPAPTDPSPTPGPESPAPPPPAPEWSSSFSSTFSLGGVSLSQVRPEVTSGSVDRYLTFSETLAGPRLAQDGTDLGSIYLEYWGWSQSTRGQVNLRLYVDGPDGPSDRYVYETVGSLQSGVQAPDGTVSLVFGGSYAVTSSPTSAEQGPESVPHDGTFQLTLRFWQDGTTLFQSSIALIES